MDEPPTSMRRMRAPFAGGSEQIDLQQTSSRTGITLRALLIGLAGVVLVAGFAPYNDDLLRNTYFVGNFFPVGVILSMLIIVLGVNPIVRRVSVRRGLSPSELMVILGMMIQMQILSQII